MSIEKGEALVSLESDFILADALVEGGLLKVINPEHLQRKATKGAVLCTCGDCKRFPPLFETSRGILPDIHTIAMPGGGFVLGHGFFEDEWSIHKKAIARAMIAQGMRFIWMSVHFPCGMVTASGYGLKDAILSNIQAKKEVRTNMPKSIYLPPAAPEPKIDTPAIEGVMGLIAIDWDKSPWPDRGIRLYGIRRKDETAIREFSA